MQQTANIKLSGHFAATGCLPACMQNLTAAQITKNKLIDGDRQTMAVTEAAL